MSIQCSSDDPSGCECEYDMILGVMVECTPGDVYCLDNETVQVCDDTSMFQYQTCEEYCESKFGDEYQPNSICDEDQSGNLCDCQLPDGDIDDDVDHDQDADPAGCLPGEYYCQSDSVLAFCEEEGGEFQEYNCNEYCQQQHGNDAYSGGCDNAANDPCQCEYDSTDGLPVGDVDYSIDGDIDNAICTLGESHCDEQDNLYVCESLSEGYVKYFCENYCVEEFGADYVSYGCDAQDTQNPCQCEYGIIEGEPIECYVGEDQCADDYNLNRCTPYDDSDPADHQGEPGYYQSMSCNDWCYETYGYDYYSLGCYEGGTELCNCEYGATDGVMPQCFPGEMYCEPNGMLSLCEGEDYYGYWSMQSCNDICAAVDPSYTSGGCDTNESENPCLCGEPDEEDDHF